MNYNSLNNRDYELYNYNSSDYPSGLINKNIDHYFNDILTQPEIKNTSVIAKSDYTWSKFYSEYIEHNILFIIILIGVVIFLIIRYYSLEAEEAENKELDPDTDTDTDDEFDSKTKKKIKKKYKKKFDKYKQQIDNEKQQILNIIDELSSMNYEDQAYTSNLENQYNQKINQLTDLQRQNEINQLQQLQQLDALEEYQKQMLGKSKLPYNDEGNELNHHQVPLKNQSNKSNGSNQQSQPGQQRKPKQTPIKQTPVKKTTFVQPDRNPLDYTIKNYDTDTDEDNSYYYKVNSKKNYGKNDVFDGFIVEPPFN